MPPVWQVLSSIFGGVFDRTCLMPLNVALYDATGGSCYSEGWVHIGSVRPTSGFYYRLCEPPGGFR